MRIAWIAVVVALLAAEAGFAQQNGTWYYGKPVKRIDFEGLRHVKSTDLEGITEPFIDRPFSDELFDELRAELFRQDYFEDPIVYSVKPADALNSSVVIKVTVKEKSVVSRISFSGVDAAGKSQPLQLRRNELLKVVVLKINDVVNQAKLIADENALVTLYLEKGFPLVKVRSETRANRDGSVTVNFLITEGQKVTLKEIKFEGNKIFSDGTLRGQLSLKAKGLFSDGAFQEAKLIADKTKLTQYYHDRGYVDAQINQTISPDASGEDGNTLRTITFVIEAGRMYTFGGMTFTNNKIFSSEELGKLVHSKVGAAVNARRLEADIQRVTDQYYDNGFINNIITPEPKRDREKGILSYEITIDERGRAHVERITITQDGKPWVGGNKQQKTELPVILREIPMEPGDVFSKSKLYDAMRNLMNLQYFSSVVPDIEPGSAEGLMNLVFNLEEQPTTNVQAGFTFSGSAEPEAFPISGLLKLNDRNFLGKGNMAGAEANLGWDTQSVALQYTQRWLFGLPLSGGFDFTFRHSRRLAAMNNGNFGPLFNGDEEKAFPDGFYSYDDYNSAGKLIPSQYLMNYDQYSLSLGFSTGYRWSTPLGGLGLGGGFRTGWVLNDYDQDLWRPFDPVLRDRIDEWVPALSWYTSLSLDQRDVYYDPSNGYYAVQRFGWYGLLPLEREHYLRTDTKAEWFFTFLNLRITDSYNLKAIFGIHSGLSFVFPQPFQQAAEIEDASKLAVDGMFTGRGWTDQRINRGLALWENWAEIRFPVVPNILGLDFFFDAAAQKPTPGDLFTAFQEEDMLYSFGAGLRISFPQFPLRFLFAKRFKGYDGQVHWEKGTLGATDHPDSGIDFVLSFNLATY